MVAHAAILYHSPAAGKWPRLAEDGDFRDRGCAAMSRSVAEDGDFRDRGCAAMSRSVVLTGSDRLSIIPRLFLRP